jgi:hypothetical protein
MTCLVVKTAVGQDLLRVLWLFLFSIIIIISSSSIIIIIIIISTTFNINGRSWDLWHGWGYDYFVINGKA